MKIRQIHKKLGRILLAERRRQDLTQMHLAKLSNVSQGTITYIENGDKNTSFFRIAKLAKQLGLSLDKIVEDIGL